MFRPHRTQAGQARRGVILLVVVTLLMLFAIVGLSFVLYANAEADASRLFRESAGVVDNRPDLGADQLLNYALGQLIYEPDDGSTGGTADYYSGLRGWGLARDMYGWNNSSLGSNIVPFDGTGRYHHSYPANGVPRPLRSQDDFSLINYTSFQTAFPATDNFRRDPEKYSPNWTTTAAVYTGGWNPPYTYPDMNHVWLGAVDSNGNIKARSFCRENWTGFGSLDPSNPNWWTASSTNPTLKYQTLRPRPADMGPNFLPPADANGDVSNLNLGVNDSIWIDLDFPVSYAPDGTKFKPLFAFFITDLDNRININTAGNVRGRNNAHLSNQGWTPSEVSLSKFLTANDPISGRPEWINLLLGNSTAATPVTGRYGADGLPTSGNAYAQPGMAAHLYAQADLEGSQDNLPTPPPAANLPNAGGDPTAQWSLPQGVAAPGTPLAFPVYPTGFSNGAPTERFRHPLLYDFFAPAGDDLRLPVSDMRWLLFDGFNGNEYANAQITQLSPTNFANAASRHLVTTDSYDVGRPGKIPWLYNPATAAGFTSPWPYQAPVRAPVASPLLTQRNNAIPTGSEFSADWRDVDAVLGKIDLNRFLPPYPHMGSGTTAATYNSTPMCPLGTPFNDGGPLQAQYAAAVQARQQLADDIYRRLLRVTGLPPIPAGQRANPTDAELQPRRWLAQLAVNIVDYIDEDDLATPFNFYNTAEDGLSAANLAHTNTATGGNASVNAELPKFWVLGTELPRVVLNEVLTEYQVPTANTGVQPMKVNVWAELFNTMPTDPGAAGRPPGIQTLDYSAVPLHIGPAAGGYSPYKIEVAYTSSAANSYGLLLPTNPVENVLGTPAPDPRNPRANNGIRTSTTDADFANITTAAGAPAPSTLAPQQYMIVGPQARDVNGTVAPPPAPGQVPPTTPQVKTPNMAYTVDVTMPGATNWTLPSGATGDDRLPNQGGTNGNGLTVLLRRLANPYLPYNPTANGPLFNPYITVDYLTGLPVNKGTAQTPPVAPNSSQKLQPYAADASQVNSGTRHTLGLNNGLSQQYDWLTHLDRQLISPAELLHVSGYHPWQLTQRFKFTQNGTTTVNGQRAPWLDQDLTTGSHSLYRLFEFLETHPRAAGISEVGRIPGKVNINTIWDAQVFNALCDQQAANHFTAANVSTVFNALSGSRTPNGTPSPGDRPFLGMAIGTSPGGGAGSDPFFPNGSGLGDTVLRPSAGNVGSTLFDVPNAAHPYIKTELVTKIFNNLTTRSNVFAVWVTVGFFKVEDDTVKPVKLGGEIGLAENQNIRHRMFAIVDRSTLNLGSSLTTLSGAVTAGDNVTVNVAATSGTTSNRVPWQIQQGSVLVVDTGGAQETITVTALNGNAIQAKFIRNHAAGCPVTIPGNPGPQPNFDTRNPKYQDIVPYAAVVQ